MFVAPRLESTHEKFESTQKLTEMTLDHLTQMTNFATYVELSQIV